MNWLVALVAEYPVATAVVLIVLFAVLDLIWGEEDFGDGGPHGWTYDPREKR